MVLAAARNTAGAFLIFLCTLFANPLLAQQSLEIQSTEIAGLQPADVSVLMTNTAGVEGFVLAISYETAFISVSDVSLAGTVTATVGAELVVSEIFDLIGGFTLGVVLDFMPPFLGQEIAPGSDQEIATFEASADTLVSSATVTSVEFLDGTLNSPTLDNILVEGGLSIGASTGLTLVDGAITLLPPPPDALRIENATIAAGATGAARILMSNSSGPVQGFVLSIAHDVALNLTGINLSGTVTTAASAEFVVPNVYPTGGTIGVVLDFTAPFAGQTIPIGADQHIANYVYSCDVAPVSPAPPSVLPLTFVDGQFGTPTLDNVLVVGGLSIAPGFTNGTATCLPVPLENTVFSCGTLDDSGAVVEQSAFPGATVPLDIFYTDPDADIQGVQIALCLADELSTVPGSFSIDGTIVEAVGAEFVMASYDNDFTDGDGHEFTVGILLDALPPFENQCLPPTATPLRMGTVLVNVSPLAECDTCYGIEFCDGIDGNEAIAVDNLIVVNYESVRGFTKIPCDICIVPGSQFLRGDCNTDTRLDLADAATVLGQQFQARAVGCLDACDGNDDGKVNLADAVFLLNYIFKSGPNPPVPFPFAGGDTTADALDCDAGLSVCP